MKKIDIVFGFYKFPILAFKYLYSKSNFVIVRKEFLEVEDFIVNEDAAKKSIRFFEDKIKEQLKNNKLQQTL